MVPDDMLAVHMLSPRYEWGTLYGLSYTGDQPQYTYPFVAISYTD